LRGKGPITSILRPESDRAPDDGFHFAQAGDVTQELFETWYWGAVFWNSVSLGKNFAKG